MICDIELLYMNTIWLELADLISGAVTGEVSVHFGCHAYRFF